MNEIINSLINDSQPIAWLTKWIVQFNDFDLSSLCNNSTWYLIQTWNELSLDNTIIEEYVSEIIDWGTIIDKRYWNKWVPFTLFIQWSSYSDLLLKIQALKKNLNNRNWTFYFTRDWTIYTYEATCNNIVIPDFNKNQDFLDNIQINFIFTSPHWSIEEPEVSQITKTANFEKIITNAWTYKSYPKIILIWKTGSSITDVNIELKKVWEVTWENVFVNESINEWDVLIIDYKEKIVTINWVETTFSWFLTPLQTGNNVFDFTFTGVVNLDIYILYNKVFL